MFRRLQALAIVIFVWALAGIVPSSQSNPAALQRSGVTIVGSVVDAALAPVAGVAITLERAGRVEKNTTTDAAGAFRFTAVAPGSYRVRAQHPGFPAFARDLRVPGDVTAVQLPIVLTRAGDNLPTAETVTPATGSTVAGAAPAAQPQLPPAGPAGVVGGRGGAMDRFAATAEPQLSGPNGDRFFFPAPESPWSGYRYPHSGERYAHVEPNRFQSARDQPLSTFGADVDTASYSNIRRFLSSGQLPPRDAVRVEELVNYFQLRL